MPGAPAAVSPPMAIGRTAPAQRSRTLSPARPPAAGRHRGRTGAARRLPSATDSGSQRSADCHRQDCQLSPSGLSDCHRQDCPTVTASTVRLSPPGLSDCHRQHCPTVIPPRQLPPRTASCPRLSAEDRLQSAVRQGQSADWL